MTGRATTPVHATPRFAESDAKNSWPVHMLLERNQDADYSQDVAGRTRKPY